MIKALNDYNKSLIYNEDLVIYFTAKWCGPCKMMVGVLEEYAKEEDVVKVIKIDVDEYPELANHFEVQSIPTFIKYKKVFLLIKS